MKNSSLNNFYYVTMQYISLDFFFFFFFWDRKQHPILVKFVTFRYFMDFSGIFRENINIVLFVRNRGKRNGRNSGGKFEH